jgi:multicomponent K+:H+ antiporter subunit A
VIRDAAVATLAGAGGGALTWAVLTRPYQSIADFFLANSVPGGGGKNVVNVILVDFRGYDTLGEITVLALAGLGIYALLENLRLNPPDADAQGRAWSVDRAPVIFAALAKLLLPLALLVAVYILLRGHNAPGGGFIAGLVAAVALVVQYLAHGGEWMRQRMSGQTHAAIAFGLVLAVATGLASFVFDAPFLTSTFGYIDWPVVGEFELASAMVFDLGVFFVVVGATLMILVNLGGLHDARVGKRWLEPR